MNPEETPKQFLALGVEGQNKELWKRLKPALLKKIEALMAFEINPEHQRTVRQEIGSYASKALEYGKAKLDKAVIENEDLKADVELKYAQAQRDFAEARERNALARKSEVEATEAEFLSELKMTRTLLRGLQAMIMTNDQGEDVILFSQDMAVYLIMIEVMEQEFRRT